MNVAILMQNQNLQQTFIESNITAILLAKKRHMINRLVDALKKINNTTLIIN